MVNKLLVIFLFILLNNVYNLSDEEGTYSITFVDNNMETSNYIIPIFREHQDFLYIVSGESLDENNNHNSNNFAWKLLKFNINSGVLFGNYTFYSNYPFDNPEVISIGDNSSYLLTTTTNSIQIFNEIVSKESTYSFYGSRRTLKKIGSYYYHAYIDNENQNNIIISQMILNNNKSIERNKNSEPVKTLIYQSMISCDYSKDNNYILCAYFSENKYITISLYNNDLDLIKTEQKENIDNINEEYFIKIVWFKDNYKFIILNSKSDYITRLRYFKYINNKLISQLYTIIDSEDQYLDIDETQLDPYQNSNDIIAVDSDKIIKIYCSGETIIITIFQFYEHDSLLFIKIYNMLSFDNIGFNSFNHPRLAMFRDSILVCLSTSYNNKQTTGFFFIGYPNSKYITLTNNNIIKINDLISIENNIFSLNLKFKILEIPKDFIFINLLDSKEIKEEDELGLFDLLILKQYKINCMYYLKYEGIAMGNDLGYSSSKVYPEEKSIPPTSEIYIEGREGNIIINFDNCLDGYYHIDNDANICTNITQKEHYLDIENKTYIACQSPCKECSGPMISYTLMNCITCQSNYNITEDTHSCYNELPDNYYLDNNIFRRCHERCKTCITGSDNDNNMKCLTCETNFFFIPDSNNCISYDEMKSNEKKEFKRVTNEYFVAFMFILILSMIISIIILCTCFCKEEKVENNKNENIKKSENDKDQNVELTNLKKPIN